MTDEKKDDLVIDDWDSLPLDPNADDDWDAPDKAPPVSNTAIDDSNQWEQPSAGVPEPISPPKDISSIDPDRLVPDAAPLATADNELPESLEINIPDSVIDELDEDVSSLSKNTGFSAPSQPQQSPAFDAHLLSEETAHTGTKESVPEPPAADLSPPADNNTDHTITTTDVDELEGSVEETTSAPIDLSTHLDVPLPDPGNTTVVKNSPAQLNDLDIESPAKKVELDIDGIFLDKHDGNEGEGLPAAQVAEEPPAMEEKPVSPEIAPPPPEGKKKLRIPHIKKLIIIVPAALIAMILVFVLFKLFFSKPKEAPPPPPPLIDSNIIPREAEPGEISLESIYVDFPGKPEDIIIEMSIIVYYKDLSDKIQLEAKLPAIRDIIYRTTQNQGANLITDAQLQKKFREELIEKCNAVLGFKGINYVQISQIRILK